jgi:hypothetical protein
VLEILVLKCREVCALDLTCCFLLLEEEGITERGVGCMCRCLHVCACVCASMRGSIDVH